GNRQVGLVGLGPQRRPGYQRRQFCWSVKSRQFRDGYPPGAGDFVELGGQVAGQGTQHVHQVYVAVRADLGVGDGHLDDHVGWGVGGDRRVREQLVADDLGVDAGLFQYLALRGLGWVLVRVDVTAGVEPPADLV